MILYFLLQFESTRYANRIKYQILFYFEHFYIFWEPLFSFITSLYVTHVSHDHVYLITIIKPVVEIRTSLTAKN